METIQAEIKREAIKTSIENVEVLFLSKYEITGEELFKRDRLKHRVDIRSKFFYIAYCHTALCYAAIGEYCLKKYNIQKFTHSTVLHGVKKCASFILNEKDVKKEIELLENDLGGYKLRAYGNKTEQIKFHLQKADYIYNKMIAFQERERKLDEDKSNKEEMEKHYTTNEIAYRNLTPKQQDIYNERVEVMLKMMN
tara:strand:- start:374 stop:961 length:588 start_codon:yes stop_codon:yes gene_type:complete